MKEIEMNVQICSIEDYVYMLDYELSFSVELTSNLLRIPMLN